jgi:hypothetical protein
MNDSVSTVDGAQRAFSVCMKLVLLALVLVVCSCAEHEYPAMTDAPCSYGEWQRELATSGNWVDVVLIVPTDLRASVSAQVGSLIEALATSSFDGDGQPDVRRNENVRVGIVTPEQAIEHLRAPEEHPVPFVTFRYAPHGLGDSTEAFLESVSCLLLNDAQSCGAGLDLDRAVTMDRAELFVFSARDACVDSGTSATCDRTLNGLFAALERVAYLDLRLAVIAGREPEPCVLAGTDLTAQPTPELFRLAPTTRQHSLCEVDQRLAASTLNCSIIDSVPVDLVREGARRRPDGTFECTVLEMLPASGPVTRCEQLAEYGREPLPHAIREGREVCVVEQRAEVEATAGAPGWFAPSQRVIRHEWSGPPDERPECFEQRSIEAFEPAFTGTEPIDGSWIFLRCYDVFDNELPSCARMSD